MHPDHTALAIGATLVVVGILCFVFQRPLAALGAKYSTRRTAARTPGGVRTLGIIFLALGIAGVALGVLPPR